MLHKGVAEQNGQGRMKRQLSLFLPTSGGLAVRHLSAIFQRKLLAVILSFFLIPSLLAEDLFFDSDGVKIHYTMEGEGEPVLLLHGLTGSSQQFMRTGIMKELSSSFKTIAMDIRGHGKSDKPHDPEAYGISFIEDPIRLLNHLGIRKTHVVGISMGGLITTAILAYYPERVRSAVLGSAGWVPPSMAPLGLDGAELAESIEQGKGMGALIAALTPVGAPPRSAEQVENISKMKLFLNDPLALSALFRNFVPSPTRDQIVSNKIPVLALIGELDPMKDSVDRLVNLMPNFKTIVIPGAGHGDAQRDPLFIENIMAFLAEHSHVTSKTR